MVKLVNRAKMTVASGGAGDITLGAAVAGYQTFADAGVSDTNVLRYTIEDGDDWEIGTGVYTASGTTLVRTVTESSNSDAALTCSADAVIFVTLAAEDFSGNAAPAWTTTPPSTIDLANDGSTAVTLAGVAIDEFPVRYSWDGYSGTTLYDADSLPPQLASAPTFSGGTATLIGSSAPINGGSFNFRLKASDGVKTATATTAVRLLFSPNIANASYDSVSFSVASQEINPRCVTFSPLGTKMYVVGNTSDTVYQYTLSSGFDLSTASYDSVSFSVASQDASPTDLSFSPLGTKMFMVGYGSDTVHQYTLSSGFDLSTASYDSISFSVSSQDSGPASIEFSPLGTKMFMSGFGSNNVHQYTLSSGFDLSTASYDNVSFSVSSQDSVVMHAAFSVSGTKMYMLGFNTPAVHQYTLSSGFDLSTATYDNVSFSVNSQDTQPSGLAFSPSGRVMCVVGRSSDKIHQYSV